MSYRPNDLYVQEFTVAHPTTGEATNATSLPVAIANYNAEDDEDFILTVANLDTGRYVITGVIPDTYEPGGIVNIGIIAVCGGVTAKAVVASFMMDRPILGGAAGGSGSKTVTLQILDPNSNPIGDADIWISTDVSGDNITAGSLSTNASGRVTFLLDPGSYYMWREKSGFTFPNPVTLVIT